MIFLIGFLHVIYGITTLIVSFNSRTEVWPNFRQSSFFITSVWQKVGKSYERGKVLIFEPYKKLLKSKLFRDIFYYFPIVTVFLLSFSGIFNIFLEILELISNFELFLEIWTFFRYLNFFQKFERFLEIRFF